MHNPAMVNVPRAIPLALPPFGRMQPASEFIPIDVSQQVFSHQPVLVAIAIMEFRLLDTYALK
jgi:hypothetical protein